MRCLYCDKTFDPPERVEGEEIAEEGWCSDECRAAWDEEEDREAKKLQEKIQRGDWIRH